MENLTTDLDSPYPIPFDQALCKTVSFQKYPFSSEKYRIKNFENLTIVSDSPYSITFDQTLWKIVSFPKYPLFSEKYII